MNKADRKRLSELRYRLSCVGDELESITSEVEGIKDDEEAKVDNLPDSLQFSERAEEMREKIDILDDIVYARSEIELSEICDKFDEI